MTIKLFAKHYIFSVVSLAVSIAWGYFVPMMVSANAWHHLVWVTYIGIAATFVGLVPSFIFLRKDIKDNK